MDYKAMTDSELAEIMVNNINRVDHLRKMISEYINRSVENAISPDQIRRVYKQLKDELREDAHYLDLSQNYEGSIVYMRYFRPSIREAAAHGFTIPTNGRIDLRMYSCVEEAHYRLSKYCSLEDWGKLI